MLQYDLDLKKSDVQSTSSRDALVALFTQLGYNTRACQ
jgi:hypothetical protein